MILFKDLLYLIEDTTYIILYTLEDSIICEGMAKDLQANYCFEGAKVRAITTGDDSLFIRIEK